MLKNLVMKAAEKKMSQEQLKNLSSTFDDVSTAVNMARNPQEVLKRYNVTNEHLKRAKTYLDNPMAQMGLKFLGMSKESAGNLIDSFMNTAPTEKAHGGRLEALQDTLARLKK